MKDLGYEEVDVVFVDLSVEQEKALNLTLNKTVGEWDEPKLARLLAEFEGFPDFDVQLTGFDEGEISDLISRVLDREVQAGNDNEFDVEGALDETRPAVTQAGELIALGEHRLLCGDSTDAEQVRRLMNGERAVLFATDLPYLVGYDGMNHPGSKGRRNHKGRRDNKERRDNKGQHDKKGQCGKNKDWSGSYGITWESVRLTKNAFTKGYFRAPRLVFDAKSTLRMPSE